MQFLGRIAMQVDVGPQPREQVDKHFAQVLAADGKVLTRRDHRQSCGCKAARQSLVAKKRFEGLQVLV